MSTLSLVLTLPCFCVLLFSLSNSQATPLLQTQHLISKEHSQITLKGSSFLMQSTLNLGYTNFYRTSQVGAKLNIATAVDEKFAVGSAATLMPQHNRLGFNLIYRPTSIPIQYKTSYHHMQDAYSFNLGL